MLCLTSAPVSVIDESCHRAGSYTPLLTAPFTMNTEENFLHPELLTVQQPHSKVSRGIISLMLQQAQFMKVERTAAYDKDRTSKYLTFMLEN